MDENIWKTQIPTPQKSYGPIGSCIYCGSKDNLSKEHIIPYSLNGTMVILKASCGLCRDKTSSLEGTISGGLYKNFRVKRGYKTYNKDKRPERLSIWYETSLGEKGSTELDIENYPGIYLVAFFPAPGILTGAPLTEMNPEIRLEVVGDPKELQKAIKAIGIENVKIGISYEFKWGDFSRVLAKIAHSYLVASYGLEGYRPFLPDLILGKSTYLCHYVGGVEGDQGMHMLSHHISLELQITPRRAYLIVNIHLLGAAKTPMYRVVAGEVTDFKRLKKWMPKN